MVKVPQIKLNTQKYKLAATGAGLIICQQRSKEGFRSLLSSRSPIVGAGLGITSAGFVEIKDVFANEPGYVVETAQEAWRESWEENLGFEKLFPLEEFIERAQSVATFHVRIDDDNGVHGCNYFALTVTDDEWDKAAVLAPGPERDGPLVEVWCEFYGRTLSRQNPEAGMRLADAEGNTLSGDFYHKHEVRTLGQIAWHVQQGLLWPPLGERI